MRQLLVLPLLCLALGGCVARALVDVATAPIKVASKGVDLATTSQSEADENRGRELRKLEERYGELERDYRKADRRCNEGDDDACAKRARIAEEMDRIRPRIPAMRGD